MARSCGVKAVPLLSNGSRYNSVPRRRIRTGASGRGACKGLPPGMTQSSSVIP
jgi:hypothetical protein